MPDTLRARTAGGGFHLFFKPTAGQKSRSNVLKEFGILGVDIRAENGMVLVEGSQATSKRTNAIGEYKFIDYDPLSESWPKLEESPDWMKAMAIKHGSSGAENSTSAFVGDAPYSNEVLDELRQALNFMDPEPRDIWLSTGLALKTLADDAGRKLWDEWSVSTLEGRAKFNARDQDRVWQSLHPTSITVRSIFYQARQNGWKGGAARAAAAQLGESEAMPNLVGLPPQRQNEAVFSHFGKLKPSAANWLIKGLLSGSELLLLFGLSETRADRLVQEAPDHQPSLLESHQLIARRRRATPSPGSTQVSAHLNKFGGLLF